MSADREDRKAWIRALPMCVVFLVAALSSTGCIIIEDDNDTRPTTTGGDGDGDGDGDNVGAIEAAWELEASGLPVSCAEAGVAEVWFASTLIGSELVFNDVFNCLDGSGVTPSLPAGSYDVEIVAAGADGIPIEPVVLVRDALVGADQILNLGLIPLEVDAVVGPVGRLTLAWQLTAGDLDLTCEEAAVDSVLVTAVGLPNGPAFENEFLCTDGGGAPLLPAGLYDIEVVSIDAAGELPPLIVVEEVQVVDGVLTDLGLIILDVGVPEFR